MTTTKLLFAVSFFIPSILMAQLSFDDYSSALDEPSGLASNGVAIGDFNNDGREDIYVSVKNGQNLLYRNDGDFVFTEVSEELGLNQDGETVASLWIDFDNDDDLDLFVGNRDSNCFFYENRGDDGFDEIDLGIDVQGNIRSINAVDFDNDGYLDIYIALVNEENHFYKNQQGKGFKNCIAELNISDIKQSMAAIFFDADKDGDQDMYQIRDGDQVYLYYENVDNTFIDKSLENQLNYVGQGMGVDVSDFNQDGILDLYVTNLYDNNLFIANGLGSYNDASSFSDCNDHGMGWGVCLGDMNNNSLNDILVVNEHDFVVDGNEWPSVLFENMGSLQFEKKEDLLGASSISSSFGSATADFDQDGRLDLFIANGLNDKNRLYRNVAASKNFIGFELKGKTTNSHGIGARIEFEVEGNQKVDQVIAGSGYCSQSSQILHFGLGEVTNLSKATIYWPSGIVQNVFNPSINTYHVIEESESSLGAGQLIWTEPIFPTQLDDVTVYFDAKEGNGALENFNGTVYAHTGVITSNSSSDSDWQHVIGNWGTDDDRVIMNDEGDDVYSISYNIEDFYGISPGEEVYQMAFVFRNQDGSQVGRETDGSDIYTPVFSPDESLLVTLIEPSLDCNIVFLNENILIQLLSNMEANFELYIDGTLVSQQLTSDFSDVILTQEEGEHEVEIKVSTETDEQLISFNFLVLKEALAALDAPDGIKNGINYFTDDSYIFQLRAPGKQHAFFLCPENEFRAEPDYQMNRSEDGEYFWIELPRSIFADGKNCYQYKVDGELTVADPYSEVVLDPWNDDDIAELVMADLPSYPSGTSGIVTAFDLTEDSYDWVHNDFVPVSENNLMVYEILMRDFLSDRSYASLIDSLDYLQRLGVNAIELMPVFEFEGNQSWGYNPSFHMALDKAYGSRDDLKRLIDEAHGRGISVILDVVFNHVFSQSPLAQLYWDPAEFRPSPDNPWLNVIAKHPFNVGYDVNHESAATKEWVKQVLDHYIEEYRFDGFRFDLSKGFTQTNSGSNAGLMSEYDVSRIEILTDYANHIWALDPDSYVIMEHFAQNDEEKELADRGMMLWGNMTHEFGEAAMGFASDMDWADYKSRGWAEPKVMAYMESHDEERLMYKILNFGDSNADYDTRDLKTALDRVAASSAIFHTLPGPKMLWQFGELGYDYSINTCVNGSINSNCRLDPKPIRWDYQNNFYRERLYTFIRALNHLRNTYPTFSTDNYTFGDGNFFLKTMHLIHPDMDAVTLVNYRIVDSEINPKFPNAGTWYEYFTGDVLEVVDTQEKISFGPGEFRIYTSNPITPPNGFFSSTTDLFAIEDIQVYPNPSIAGQSLQVSTELLINGSFELVDQQGRQLEKGDIQNGQLSLSSNYTEGLYFLFFKTSEDNYYRSKLFLK